MRVEPNRRCGVQGSGSTVRADGRDSGSAPRFSAILRFDARNPHTHRAIGNAMPIQMFPNEGRWWPSHFPSGDFHSGFQPWAIIQRQRIEDDRIQTRLEARSRLVDPDRRPLRIGEGKRGIRPALPMVGFGLEMVQWFLLDSNPTREWLALTVGLFDEGIVHIAILATRHLAFPMACKRTTPFQPFPFLRITPPRNRMARIPQ